MKLTGTVLSLLGASCLAAFATAAPASARAKPCCYNSGQYFNATPSTCYRYGGRVIQQEYCQRYSQSYYGYDQQYYGGYYGNDDRRRHRRHDRDNWGGEGGHDRDRHDRDDNRGYGYGDGGEGDHDRR